MTTESILARISRIVKLLEDNKHSSLNLTKAKTAETTCGRLSSNSRVRFKTALEGLNSANRALALFVCERIEIGDGNLLDEEKLADNLLDLAHRTKAAREWEVAEV